MRSYNYISNIIHEDYIEKLESENEQLKQLITLLQHGKYGISYYVKGLEEYKKQLIELQQLCKTALVACDHCPIVDDGCGINCAIKDIRKYFKEVQ